MPATKNQALRLEILDELLSLRGWTLKELLERINSRIGDSINRIDKRTLFRDLSYLIEQRHAPVHRPGKKDNRYYYTESFSLKNIPIDDDDVASMKNAIQILRQVDSFGLTVKVEEVIRKLENRIHIETTKEAILIQFEAHTTSMGTEYIQELMDAIKCRNTLRIAYQPFTLQQPVEKVVHPYLLKEFRNRWFLLAREGNSGRVTNYALDRIKKIRLSDVPYHDNDLFDAFEYFKHIIGVSVPEGARPENIEIRVHRKAAPYVRSKPLHSNQEVVRTYKDGSMLIRVNLIINHELKSILLSYGPGLAIRKPKVLRDELRNIVAEMMDLYR